MKDECENTFTAIRKGDLKAFELFYKMYQPRVFVYGFGILDDSCTTKDLVQDTFLVFWKNRKHLLADNSVITYLFKIFQCKCTKYFKMNGIVKDIAYMSELKMQEIEKSDYHLDSNEKYPIFKQDTV